MATNDDGSDGVTAGLADLDETPEMKRLLESLRSLPLDKTLRILKKLMEAAGLPFEIVPLPKDAGDKGE